MPGATTTPFTAVSKLLPGITTAYVFAVWPDDRILATLPDAVARKITPYLGFEHTGRTLITVGPMHSPNTNTADVIRSFSFGLARLRRFIKDKDVQAFAALADAKLTDLLQRLGQEGEKDARQAVCQFAAEVRRPGIQSEVANAIGMTLCANEPFALNQ